MGNLKKLLVFAAISLAALPGVTSADGASPVNGPMTGTGFTIDSSSFSVIGSRDGTTFKEGGGNFNAFAARAVKLLMISLALLCTVLIVAGGIWMSVAGGDSDRVSRGKTLVTYALVGLAVALSSYALISLV